MRIVRLSVLAALVAAVGCADLKALSALATDVQSKYGPANVNLNNGTHLSILFADSPTLVGKRDSAGRAALAGEVAAFAKAHYANAATLDDITVVFGVVRRMGPLTVSRSDPPYTFAIRDLP